MLILQEFDIAYDVARRKLLAKVSVAYYKLATILLKLYSTTEKQKKN